MIEAQDDGVDWDSVLDETEALRENIVDAEVLARFADKFGWTSQEAKVVQSNLFHMMHQYTAGTTQSRITTAGRKASLEQYRTLYFEGMSVSDHALFLAKGRVWRVQEAKRAADFAAAAEVWESDREFLERFSNYEMPESDQQYCLLHIAPAETRKEVLKDYSLVKYPTYGLLKQHIQNLITRDRDLAIGSKGVNEIQKPKKEEEYPQGGD